MNRELIFVTRPALAPLEEFIPYVQEISENRPLTNSGSFHVNFEAALAKRFGAGHLSLFNSRRRPSLTTG